MPDFDTTGLIITPAYDSIEFRIRGVTRESNNVPMAKIARGLFGGVTVESRSISKGETQAHIIDSYDDLLELLDNTNAYIKHLNKVIDNDSKAEDIPGCVSLAEAYQDIMDSLVSPVFALYTVANSLYFEDDKIWLSRAPGRELWSDNDSDTDSSDIPTDSDSEPEPVNIPSRTNSAVMSTRPQDEVYNALERERRKTV